MKLLCSCEHNYSKYCCTCPTHVGGSKQINNGVEKEHSTYRIKPDITNLIIEYISPRILSWGSTCSAPIMKRFFCARHNKFYHFFQLKNSRTHTNQNLKGKDIQLVHVEAIKLCVMQFTIFEWQGSYNYMYDGRNSKHT